jgi:hypothetical protein
MPEFTAKELNKKSLEELATLGERYHPQSAEGILIGNAIQRKSEKRKGWYERPLGMIAIGLVTSLLAVAALRACNLG